METWGVVVLLVGAVVIGLVAEYAVHQQLSYEWVIAAIGAAIGGFVASEYLGSLSDWGTHWQGLRIWPALIGGILIGGIVEYIVHSLVHQPTSTHGTGTPPTVR